MDDVSFKFYIVKIYNSKWVGEIGGSLSADIKNASWKFD